MHTSEYTPPPYSHRGECIPPPPTHLHRGDIAVELRALLFCYAVISNFNIQVGIISVPECRRGVNTKDEVKERGREGGKLDVTQSKLSDTILVLWPALVA
jgi:hypothetical protein